MKKEEFLRILERKLEVINEKERKDIIDEYRTHIEMKMQEGKSEEEAIEDFGDIDELVDEILDAYKINTDRVNHSFDSKLNHIMDELFEGFQRLLGSFTSLNVDDVVRLVFEILVILLLLAILQIPFRIIASLGGSLLHSLAGFGIGTALSALWKFIIGVAYVVIFVVVLVNLITRRVQRYRAHDTRGEGVFEDFKESFDFDKAKENMQGFRSKNRSTQHPYYDSEEDDVFEEEQREDFDDNASREDPYRDHDCYEQRVERSVTGVADILLKIFFCLMMIPCIGILIGLCCVLGAMVVMSIQGITLYGAYFIVCGALVVLGGFLSLLYRALWRRG